MCVNVAGTGENRDSCNLVIWAGGGSSRSRASADGGLGLEFEFEFEAAVGLLKKVLGDGI